MKRSAPIWFLLLTSAALAGGPVIPDDVRDSVRARVASGSAPAIVVGLVDASGTTYYSAGKTAHYTQDDVGPDTLFEIGSITKVFTALVLADMVQRGELALDDPVRKCLPPKTRLPVRDNKEITLQNLATHTSGLPRLPSNVSPGDVMNPYADYTSQRLYDFLATYRLPRDIDAKYEYSNLGFGLLGHALSLKAGKGFEKLVIDRICNPLGMKDTVITLSPAQRPRMAYAHSGLTQVQHWDFDCLAGCGALRSTARDMTRFLTANMGLSDSKLSDAMRLTHQPRRSAGRANLKVGLGWHISSKNDKSLLWHNGGTGGSRSFCGFDPQGKLGVVVLANSAESVDDIGMHLLDERFKLVEVYRLPAVSPETLQKYVGEYKLDGGTTFTVTRQKDGLYLQLTNQPAYPVYPDSDTRFFYKIVEAEVTFVVNAEGRATALVLHQNGIDQTFKRKKN